MAIQDSQDSPPRGLGFWASASLVHILRSVWAAAPSPHPPGVVPSSFVTGIDSCPLASLLPSSAFWAWGGQCHENQLAQSLWAMGMSRWATQPPCWAHGFWRGGPCSEHGCDSLPTTWCVCACASTCVHTCTPPSPHFCVNLGGGGGARFLFPVTSHGCRYISGCSDF